jgi:uncharacterized protein (DUF302 family)
MRFSRLLLGRLLAGLTLLLFIATAAAAQDLVRMTKAGDFAEIRADLTDAITSKGLVIDFNGKIGAMLDRTGEAVGSTKKIYRNAEYFTFCSAKLSRDAMEADPLAIAHCPYVVFIYETEANPGQIVVGYRRPLNWGVAAQALRRVDTLLETIVRETMK